MRQTEKWRLLGRRAAVVAASLLVLYTGYSWVSVLGQPNMISSAVPGPFLQHDVRMDYDIRLAPCTLYPEGALVEPGERTIPMKIFDGAHMTLTNSLSYLGLELTGGQYWVDVLVRAGDLWEKLYPILDKQRIEPGSTLVEAKFELPLTQIIRDAAKVEEELSMGSPTGQYAVDVRLHTVVEMHAGENKVHEFAPSFTFVIERSGLALQTPGGDLTQTDRYSEVATEEKTNTRVFLGRERSVADLKQGTLGVFSLACASLAGVVAWSRDTSASKSRSRLRSDPARAYRDRLVRVMGFEPTQAGPSIRVSGIKELARIADEAQVCIMEIDPEAKHYPPEFDAEPSPQLQGRRFFAVVGNTTYYVV